MILINRFFFKKINIKKLNKKYLKLKNKYKFIIIKFKIIF